MAKFEEVSEETKKVFTEVISQRGLPPHQVTFDIVSDNKQKTLHKVSKANPYVKYKSGVDVVIYINEDIFWQLEDDQQIIVAEEAIAGVSYSSERDSINIEKPDVVTYSGILRKFGAEKHEILRESVKSLYDKEEKGEESGKAKTLVSQ